MLKIKDEVDLKELEKFGLKKMYSETDEAEIYSMTDEMYSGQSIIVFCDDRTIWATGYTIITKLYDLIQAGLVEKVEG